MRLASGSRLGPYEIVSKLSEGGMGEVYKALDTRLGRTVAVKILSSRLASDPDLRARFDREARAISSLSHPHVCALFDIGQEGDTDYLVMEFLDGETLAERLVKGPLPLAEAVRLGGQIAAALDKAHRLGIVHRDLKPGNVMLTASGVKLLDFGLAKLHAGPARNLTLSSVASLVTHVAPSEPLTVEGTLLGTPQYMAPEQLECRVTDTRADLWAFGCVLYEMLTGQKAFAGANQASLIAAVLGPGPGPASRLAPSTPPELDRLIQSCLVKDPEQRWQSAHDAALELTGLAVASDGTRGAPVARRGSRWVAGALGIALVAVLAGIGLGRGGQFTTRLPEVRFLVSPPPGAKFLTSVETKAVALSPDGRAIAFAAVDDETGSRLWVRRVDEIEARQLAGTEGATSLTWSPDGQSIAFFTDGKLKRLDLAGGTAVPICDVAHKMGFSATWGIADQILFASIQGDAIYRVSALGGLPQKLQLPDPSRKEIRVAWPTYLPDGGGGFLYLARTADLHWTLMLAEPGKPPRVVASMDSRVEFVGPERLVFAREGALLAQRFDRTSARLVGAPSSVAPVVRSFLSSGWSGFAASPEGSIVYLSQFNSSRLVWFDRAGKPLGSVGPVGDYLGLAISPDGRTVFADRTQPQYGTYDVWQIDIERDVETRLTSAPDADFEALWLPDGQGMVYSSLRGRAPNLVQRDLVTGKERVLLPRGTFQSASDVTLDGRLLAFRERGDGGRFHAWTLHLEGEPRAERLFATGAQEGSVRFSPDGAFVVYLSDDSGSNEVYVSPLANRAQKTRISPQGASGVRWSRDGREIFLLTAAGQMLAVPIATVPGLKIGAPQPLFSLPEATPWGNFDVDPSGKRFLAIVREREGAAQPATAVLHWTPPGE